MDPSAKDWEATKEWSVPWKDTSVEFIVHDQEQICQNMFMTKNRFVKTTDPVHIYSDLEFGIDAPTTGSRQNIEAELQHRGMYVLLTS
jgi:hypothetical protein